MTGHEDDILSPLTNLSRVTPSPDATARAIERARAALTSEMNTLRAARRRRIVMSSGIAAVVVIGAVIVGTLWNPPGADAAALLQEVAGANQAYRGWVHMRSEEPGEKPGDALHIGYSHVNTIDGTWVLDHQHYLVSQEGSRLQPPEEAARDFFGKEEKSTKQKAKKIKSKSRKTEKKKQ